MRIRWDIEQDIIRGRRFDFGKHVLPVGLARASGSIFLSASEQRWLDRMQARTDAHRFGDQVALEAGVHFMDEEREHQALPWFV